MKIICSDNFGREGPGHDDKLVAENITDVEDGPVMADALNVKFGGEQSPYYYRVVDDDYKLQIFEP